MTTIATLRIRPATPISTTTTPIDRAPARAVVFPTALGFAAAAWRGELIIRIVLPCRTRRAARIALEVALPKVELDQHGHPLVEDLVAYFCGSNPELSHYRVDLNRLGEFSAAVLQRTRRIPYGATTTYGDIARDLGRPQAARAVGGALGRNPLPVLVPCHRVLAADG
ncbi:MAG: methylated-DNA--[protein]-cysteine S-methyltransferase, partial [Candidatus Alcyoniella australis]|nr:methylated-DNA--[protein]-cysteine S-methyltransferase [Candidatus Alcyoniella australis]